MTAQLQEDVSDSGADDLEPVISDEDVDECEARFKCHHCCFLIAEGSAVYMRRDASYCSPGCRRKGRSGQVLASKGSEEVSRRQISCGTNASISSYRSDTVSVDSTSDGGSTSIGPGERLLRGVLGWVIGKVRASSSKTDVDGLPSASFGSWSALPSVGSALGGDPYCHRDCSGSSDFATFGDYRGM